MQRERYITNTVFLFGTSLIAQIVSFFILPLFISNLGKEIYGLFVISHLLLGYVGLLDFGFTAGLMRQIGRAHASGDRKALAHAVSTGFWLLVWVGCAAAALIYFGREFIMDFLKLQGADRVVAARILTVTAVFSLIQWPMRLPGTVLKATLYIKPQSIISGVTAMVSSLTMLALVLFSVDVVGILLGVYGVSVLGWIPMIWLVRRNIPELVWHPWRFDWNTLRAMFGFSLGFFYQKVLGMLAIKVDHFIIGHMLGIGFIAYYVVASKPFGVVRRFTAGIFGALMPTVFSLDTNQNRHKLQRLLEEGTRYRALLVTPLAYTAILLSPPFIRLWMGPGYADVGQWAQLYLLVYLSTYLGTATAIARGTGKLKVCNIYYSITIAINVAVSILTVPTLGYAGPIVGTVIANVFGGYIAFPFFSWACGLRWRKSYWLGIRIMACNLPLALLLYVLLPPAWLASWGSLCVAGVLLFSVFYGTPFVLFVGEKEIKDFKIAFRSAGVMRLKPLRRLLHRVLRVHRYLRHYLRVDCASS
jgi:O-antigen/teichoic acid export membrane protein